MYQPRRSWLRTLIVALLLLACVTAQALADEPGIPPRPEGAPAYSETTPLYDQAVYPYTAYTWDGEQWSATGYAATYTGLNLALISKAWFVKVALRLSEWATEPSLTANLFERIAEPAEAIGNRLWTLGGAPLVGGALALSGGWALLLYLWGRGSRAWGALGATALVLLLAAAILPRGELIATALGKTSDGLATAVLTAVKTDAPLLAQAGDGAWRRLVYEPWLEGELSTAGGEHYRDAGGLPGGEFLAKTGSERRSECLFNGAVNCPSWLIDSLPQRLLSALATGVMALCWGGALLLLSGGLLLTRLTLAALLLLAPVWLLVALWWPEGALGIVRRIGGLAVGVVVKQFLLSAGLLLFLLLSLGLDAGLSELAWPLPALLLALLGAGAVRYRYAWFRPLAARPGRPVMAPVVREQRERRERVVVAPPPVRVEQVPVNVEVNLPVAAAPPPRQPVPESQGSLGALQRELLLHEVRRELEPVALSAAASEVPEWSPATRSRGESGGPTGRMSASRERASEPVTGPPPAAK